MGAILHASAPYYQRIAAFKAHLIEEALRESDGVRAVAAERLGLTREYFQRLILTVAVTAPPARQGGRAGKVAKRVRAEAKPMKSPDDTMREHFLMIVRGAGGQWGPEAERDLRRIFNRAQATGNAATFTGYVARLMQADAAANGWG